MWSQHSLHAETSAFPVSRCYTESVAQSVRHQTADVQVTTEQSGLSNEKPRDK